MATRTSSPPASRSKSSSARSLDRGARPREAGRREQVRRKPAEASASPARRQRRGAPSRAAGSPQRAGSGLPGLQRARPRLVAGLAGRRPRDRWGRTPDRPHGRRARPRAPSRRGRLFLVGLAVVVAAAVWWQLPGGFGDVIRTVVAGSVGLLAWFVPCCCASWPGATCATLSATARAGRQVVGWTALLFGVLGIVHIANGSPTPELGDTAPLQQAGGAIGFVVAKLLTDLLQTAYVVVPLLVLLALFGVLVVTATPVYQVPARLRELGRPAHGPPRARRGGAPDRGPGAAPRGRRTTTTSTPRWATRRTTHPSSRGASWKRGRRTRAGERREIDPTPSRRRGRRHRPRTPSSHPRTPRCPPAWSSSRCPATSPTRCPTARCSSPARCTRRARRPPTTSSSG